MDKKAYYRYADIGMYILSFTIIAIAIGIGIFIFYSNQVDIRNQEAEIMSVKIVRGIVEDGLFDLDNINIYEITGLNPKVIKNGDFYFKVEIFENGESKKVFEEGKRGFEVECFLNSEKFPKCDTKEFVVGVYEVKVLTGSNQLGRGV